MWNNNNRAHTTTWYVLRVLHQGLGPFPSSGQVKMSKLFFWNSAASAQMRGVQANALAAQMDNMFRLVYKAEYESGQDAGTATAAIVAVLTIGNKTILQLAKAVDDMYKFWQEGTNA